jgi:membrane fusion protein (multidrug efflux system)
MKISPSEALSVVALLPGFDRPRLAVGMTLQIELPGYHKTREEAVIDTIGSQVIGPEEARKSLGDPIGDALPITGPVVIVRAHLTARTFEAGGRAYAFHDGMVGKAEVRVDHERLLRVLLPGNGD